MVMPGDREGIAGQVEDQLAIVAGPGVVVQVVGWLEKLYEFLIEKAITPSLPSWKRPWRRAK